MKKKILAIMMAGIATCTVFAVCGKTESNAIGSQVSTSTVSPRSHLKVVDFTKRKAQEPHILRL